MTKKNDFGWFAETEFLAFWRTRASLLAIEEVNNNLVYYVYPLERTKKA